jgi:hypothetical protein
MPEKRRKLDPEFREGAVRIVQETGKPIRLKIVGGDQIRDWPDERSGDGGGAEHIHHQRPPRGGYATC